MGKESMFICPWHKKYFKVGMTVMTLVLCKVSQCSLRRLSAPDGARATWQRGLLVWPVVKEEPQVTLLQWDRRRMWCVFRGGSTWGQYSGWVYPFYRCTQQQLTTGKHRWWWALSAVPWSSPAWFCSGDLEKNHFACLEIIVAHHAKSSVYDN